MDRPDYKAIIGWSIYCSETSGVMDTRDSWEELPKRVQDIYRDKADEYVRQRLFKKRN